MKKLVIALSLLAMAALVLTACGGQAEAPAATESPAESPAATEAPASGLPDLGGKTLVVAVENAYPPFNMIDEASGEGVGWDYDTVNEICESTACLSSKKPPGMASSPPCKPGNTTGWLMA